MGEGSSPEVATVEVGEESGLEPEDVAVTGEVDPPPPAVAAWRAAACMAAACIALQCERSEGGSPGRAGGAAAADWAARAAYICWRRAWWRSEAAEDVGGSGGAAEGGEVLGGCRGCGGAGGLAAAADISIMALAFSAAAAATIRLLFSASVEKRGFLKRRAGSMKPGGTGPMPPMG